MIFPPFVQALRSQLTSGAVVKMKTRRKSDTECLEPSPARRHGPVQLCMRSAEATTDYLQAIESTTRKGKRASLG